MKAKEYLLSKGHIDKVGKGRISYANHERLQAAWDDGVRFSDWGPNRVAVMVTETTHKETGKVTERTTAHRIDSYDAGGVIEDIAPYLYNHDTHAAYEHLADGSRGKRRSLREVCGNDRVSLVQCTCGAPKVVARDGQGFVPVTIVAEVSKPLAGNIWDKPKR